MIDCGLTPVPMGKPSFDFGLISHKPMFPGSSPLGHRWLFGAEALLVLVVGRRSLVVDPSFGLFSLRSTMKEEAYAI